MRVFLILLAFFPVLLLNGAETVFFERPLKSGDRFECLVNTSQSRQYTLLMPSVEKPAVRLNTVKVNLSGILTVRKVDSAGKALEIEFDVHSLTGAVNGRAAETQGIAGKSFTADLSKAPAVFESENGIISQETKILLASLFRPVSAHGLTELTGQSHVLGHPGESWSPDLTAFSEALRRRRIILPPSDIKGRITYTGKDRFRGLDCFTFRFFIQSKKIAGYDFRFSALIQLPADPAAGPPVRVTREATEVIDRLLSASNPLAAGAKLKLISSDKTDMMMFPVRFLKEKPVPQKEESFWDSLLR